MGTLLYYVQEDDSTMLTVLIYITEKQANPTEWKKEKVKQFLNYAATHPYAIITHHAIDMILAGHINASYFSETKSRIQAVGHFFMSNNTYFPSNNGTVLSIVKIIKVVMSSMEEAVLGALFVNSKKSIPARQS